MGSEMCIRDSRVYHGYVLLALFIFQHALVRRGPGLADGRRVDDARRRRRAALRLRALFRELARVEGAVVCSKFLLPVPGRVAPLLPPRFDVQWCRGLGRAEHAHRRPVVWPDGGACSNNDREFGHFAWCGAACGTAVRAAAIVDVCEGCGWLAGSLNSTEKR